MILNFQSSVSLGFRGSDLGLKISNIVYRIPGLESKTNNSIMIKLYCESFMVRGV